MRRVLLGLTCNNACLFCAQGRLRETVVVDARTTATALATIIPGEDVALVGGEPTLLADLPGVIAACLARGAGRIVVQTNGRRLAYAGYVASLAAVGGGRLYLDVSLQGSTREMHDFHTSVQGSFAQTVTGLRHARAAGLPTGVSVVITRSNYRHLVDIARVAQAVGARALRSALVEPVGRARARADQLVPPLELLRPHLVAAARECRRLGLPSLGTPREGAFPFAGIGEVEPNDA